MTISVKYLFLIIHVIILFIIFCLSFLFLKYMYCNYTYLIIITNELIKRAQFWDKEKCFLLFIYINNKVNNKVKISIFDVFNYNNAELYVLVLHYHLHYFLYRLFRYFFPLDLIRHNIFQAAECYKILQYFERRSKH